VQASALLMQETILQIISNATVAVVFCKRMETLQPIVARAGKFFGVRRIFCLNFPKLAPKN